MKMIAEYLEHALNFERMAAEETNPAIKAVFEKQAAAYRKLIAARAKQFGLDDPRYLDPSKDG
jgi:bacterioferritin (cytochrome b1)